MNVALENGARLPHAMSKGGLTAISELYQSTPLAKTPDAVRDAVGEVVRLMDEAINPYKPENGYTVVPEPYYDEDFEEDDDFWDGVFGGKFDDAPPPSLDDDFVDTDTLPLFEEEDDVDEIGLRADRRYDEMVQEGVLA